MAQKETAKWKVAIIGIGFVLGVAMLIFGGRGNEGEEVKADSADEYRLLIESGLEELCSAVTGSEVKVFVSFEEGYSYAYALDSRGGVVTVGSGNSERAIVESVAMPKIGGVGIVYRGTANEGELLELVSSALGIGKNKIFIVGAKKASQIS